MSSNYSGKRLCYVEVLSSNWIAFLPAARAVGAFLLWVWDVNAHSPVFLVHTCSFLITKQRDKAHPSSKLVQMLWSWGVRLLCEFLEYNENWQLFYLFHWDCWRDGGDRLLCCSVLHREQRPHLADAGMRRDSVPQSCGSSGGSRFILNKPLPKFLTDMNQLVCFQKVWAGHVNCKDLFKSSLAKRLTFLLSLLSDFCVS